MKPSTYSKAGLVTSVAMVHPLVLCVTVALLTVVHAKVTDRRGPLNLSFSKMAVYMEDSCTKVGGMCMEQDECPKGKLLKRGLCPEQRKRGVECCNGLPLSLTECGGLGGKCRKDCTEELQLKRADDCPVEEICCRLE